MIDVKEKNCKVLREKMHDMSDDELNEFIGSLSRITESLNTTQIRQYNMAMRELRKRTFDLRDSQFDDGLDGNEADW